MLWITRKGPIHAGIGARGLIPGSMGQRSYLVRGLANPDRLLIVLWLADTTSTVRELEEVTGLSQSLVSYHLRTLRNAGLVTSTPVGRANAYRLAHPDLDKLVALVGRLETA